MNAIDTIIEYLSPKTALARQRARSALEKLRNFEAASMGDRVKNWNSSQTSANSAVIPSLRTLRGRIRHIIRNDPLAKKCHRTLATKIVGTGIYGMCEEKSQAANRFNALFEAWVEDESLFCDYDGFYNLYGLQYLIALTLVESGACFIVKRIAKMSELPEGVEIPLQIQVLEPDHLDLDRTQLADIEGNYIENGIEYNSKKKRVAYWLYPEHPGDNHGFRHYFRNVESVRVPVEDVEHVFLRTRCSLNHGIPWLEAVALILKDYGDFEDAHLLRQKVAACFMAYIEDIEAPDADSSGKVKENLFDNVNPASIEVLPSGKKMGYLSPPGVEGYEGYTTGQKQRVAAGTLLTYESVSGDLSKVNFSSARIGQHDTKEHMDVFRNLVIYPKVCNKIAMWFRDLAIILGKIPHGKKLKMTWTPPRTPFIEPVKDVVAKVKEIKAGFTSPFEVLRSLGKNPKKFLKTYAEEMAYIESLGLNLDSLPGAIAQANAGVVHDAESKESPEKEGEKPGKSGEKQEESEEKDDETQEK